jgi:hypothetical protein
MWRRSLGRNRLVVVEGLHDDGFWNEIHVGRLAAEEQINVPKIYAVVHQ